MNSVNSHINQDIEKLREKMCQLIHQEGHTSRNVIKASQELDKLIIQYQKKSIRIEQ